MTEGAKTFFRRFDERIWPAPCEKMHDLAHRLIHGKETTLQDARLAASIISAYMMLIETTRDNRQMIVAELRQGPNI